MAEDAPVHRAHDAGERDRGEAVTRRHRIWRDLWRALDLLTWQEAVVWVTITALGVGYVWAVTG